jgi:UPF0271 protein
VPRSEAGAVLHDADIIARRALKMVRDETVVAIDGTDVPLKFETICVHGDTADALEIIQAIRRTLEANNITLRAFGR